MLSDTDAPLVLCSRSTSRVIPQGFAGKIFVLDEAVLDSEPVIPPEVLPGPENLAYVLYTSGSTGRPKGVMIEHRNVMTLLYGFQQVAPADGECAGMSVCPFVFDVSVWEFFINLCFGGTLHLLPEEACFDPELLAAYISGHGITTAYIPHLVDRSSGSSE